MVVNGGERSYRKIGCRITPSRWLWARVTNSQGSGLQSKMRKAAKWPTKVLGTNGSKGNIFENVQPPCILVGSCGWEPFLRVTAFSPRMEKESDILNGITSLCLWVWWWFGLQSDFLQEVGKNQKGKTALCGEWGWPNKNKCSKILTMWAQEQEYHLPIWLHTGKLAWWRTAGKTWARTCVI